MEQRASEIALIGKFVFLALSGVGDGGVCKEDEIKYRKNVKI